MTDAEILVALDAWAQAYCNTTWTALTVPAGVTLFLNQALNFIKGQSGIASESLGDYSVSFVTSFPPSLLSLLRPYRQVSFI